MFLHAGLLHLVGNMLFFWIFAPSVEEAFGHLRFIVLYLLCGFAAGILHILTNIDSTIPAIGASGAIAGLMGAYFVLYPCSKITTLFIYRLIDVPAYLYLGCWILFQVLYASIYSSLDIRPSVAWYAHIGGFVSGVILTRIYKRIRSKNGIVKRGHAPL